MAPYCRVALMLMIAGDGDLLRAPKAVLHIVKVPTVSISITVRHMNNGKRAIQAFMHHLLEPF